MEQKKYILSFKKLLILMISIGILSGIVIFWMFYNYIFPLLFSGNEIVVSKPHNIIVKDFNLEDFILQQRRSSIFLVKKNLNSSKRPFYINSDYLGIGFAITSDGWFIADELFKTLKTDYLSKINNIVQAIDYKGHKYKIDQYIIDKATGLMFFKISVKGYESLQFQKTRDLQLGDKLVLYCGDRRNIQLVSYLGVFYPKKFDFSKESLSSEYFVKSVLIDKDLSKIGNDCAVFTTQGWLVALMSKSKNFSRLVPYEYFSAQINNILKSQKIIRPYLGVKYIDLGAVIYRKEGSSRGALLYNFGRPSIDNKDLKTKLKNDDIIVSVNGEKIGDHNLTEIIQDFPANSIVKLEIIRNNQKKNIDIQLGVIETKIFK